MLLGLGVMLCPAHTRVETGDVPHGCRITLFPALFAAAKQAPGTALSMIAIGLMAVPGQADGLHSTDNVLYYSYK
jgi:hypothetical protein